MKIALCLTVSAGEFGLQGNFSACNLGQQDYSLAANRAKIQLNRAVRHNAIHIVGEGRVYLVRTNRSVEEDDEK